MSCLKINNEHESKVMIGIIHNGITFNIRYTSYLKINNEHDSKSDDWYH